MDNFRAFFLLSFVLLNVTSLVLCQTCLEGERAKKFNERLVQDHNKYRSQHGTPPLEADLNLIEDALKWSKELTATNGWDHGSTGENLWKMSITGPIDESQLDPVKSWYDEIKMYTKPEFSHDTGHFTQVIWRDSRKLGCGVCSGSGGTIVTCRYSPAGNVLGQFEENVPPLKSGGSDQDDNSDSNNVQSTADDVDTSDNTIPSSDDRYRTGEIELDEITSTINQQDFPDTTSESSDYEETTSSFRKKPIPSTTPQPNKDSNFIEILLLTLAIIVLILSLLPLGILFKYMYNQFTSRQGY